MWCGGVRCDIAWCSVVWRNQIKQSKIFQQGTADKPVILVINSNIKEQQSFFLPLVSSADTCRWRYSGRCGMRQENSSWREGSRYLDRRIDVAGTHSKMETKYLATSKESSSSKRNRGRSILSQRELRRPCRSALAIQMMEHVGV